MRSPCERPTFREHALFATHPPTSAAVRASRMFSPRFVRQLRLPVLRINEIVVHTCVLYWVTVRARGYSDRRISRYAATMSSPVAMHEGGATSTPENAVRTGW